MKPLIDVIQKNLTDTQSQYFCNYYAGKRVAVTGGASFIGSNLVEVLKFYGSSVVVIDDFSSGTRSNLSGIEEISIIEGDLSDRNFSLNSLRDIDVVFHLAAIHGGRGFIETYKQEMLVNLVIDNNILNSAKKNGIQMVVQASSACSYPINLQNSESFRNLLQESQASMETPEGSNADGVYGWTKLIGEYQLENYCSTGKMKGRSARIFTAYGERENESHAAIALIAKALLKVDPYPVWGNGLQTRNFTYVADTVAGLLFLGSDNREVPFDVFNIGTSEHIQVIEFVNNIFSSLGWKPNEIRFELNRPTGVSSRASDNSKIVAVFGWSPTFGIIEGISRTIDWYRQQKDSPKTEKELLERLIAR